MISPREAELTSVAGEDEHVQDPPEALLLARPKCRALGFEKLLGKTTAIDLNEGEKILERDACDEEQEGETNAIPRKRQGNGKRLNAPEFPTGKPKP